MILNKKSIAILGSKLNDNAPGSDISSFARKQMEKMGWVEGKGLGKTENGMITHIKVKKIEDNEGLGSKAQKLEMEEGNANWWHDGFANALKNMNSKTKKKKSKHSKEIDDKPPSYDDLFKATGGARLGMRASGDQSGKWKRSEALDNTSSSTIDLLKAKEEKTLRKLEKRKLKELSKERKNDDNEVEVDESEKKSKKSKKSKHSSDE